MAKGCLSRRSGQATRLRAKACSLFSNLNSPSGLVLKLIWMQQQEVMCPEGSGWSWLNLSHSSHCSTKGLHTARACLCQQRALFPNGRGWLWKTGLREEGGSARIRKNPTSHSFQPEGIRVPHSELGQWPPMWCSQRDYLMLKES